MGVTSVRFNAKEEKVLQMLTHHFHCDYSTLIKKSLWEMYEDIKDQEAIEDFESKESKNQTKFSSFEDILQD